MATYVPVTVVPSGGAPFVQVSGNAPAMTVVPNAAPITLVTTNAPGVVLYNPDGTPYTGGTPSRIRTQPGGDGNSFYVVTNVAGTVRKYFIARGANYGGNGPTDLGGQWPESRLVDFGEMPSMNDNPISSGYWSTSANGALDVILNNGSKSFGSYHGVGVGGSLSLETILGDGVSINPFSTSWSGDAFSLTNDVTATDGTTTWQRSLSLSVDNNGEISFTLNANSVTGTVAYMRVGMVITDKAYYEADYRVGSGFSTVHYLSGSTADDEGRGLMRGVSEFRARNPVNGRYAGLAGFMPIISGFVYAELLREVANDRMKGYLGRFNSYTSLAGASWTLKFGTGAAGSVAEGINLLPNSDFSGVVAGGSGGSWNVTNEIPTSSLPTVNSGVLTMGSAGAGWAMRVSAIIASVVSGSWYCMRVDVGGTQAAGFNATNGTSTTAAAFSQSTQRGRNIQVFVANQNNPSQRMLLAVSAGTAGSTATFANPKVMAVSA